ncbi:hypothetical protein [Mesorhizobium sp. M0664]|uniref:hypothetical protein n=1 Tax=Mesorhizobium sp. M0664 TaxID=2956982 RepID=UPI003338CA59
MLSEMYVQGVSTRKARRSGKSCAVMPSRPRRSRPSRFPSKEYFDGTLPSAWTRA